jgi:tetratricopeptide (TPR) repeat protein
MAQESKPRAYALASAPLEIRDRLPELDMGPVPRLPAGERKVLTRVWDLKSKRPGAPLKLEEAQLLEAMLFASGVEGATERQHYRERYAALLARARKAVKNTRDPRQRAEKLMKFLHASVMRNGFETGQTSLAVLFDTGKFNCVSSAALYYLIGSNLGLDLRVISIPANGTQPGHASLNLVAGGKRIQVEPTSPDGFDWQAKIHRPGVVVTQPLPDRKGGHEVDSVGLAAMMYFNRGVALGRAKRPRPLDAARYYLAALALDPTDEGAANNLVATFVNWGGPTLTGEKKFDEAVRVLAFGLSIAPSSDLLRNNLRVAWAQYVEAALEAGKDKEALALIARAARAVPDGQFPGAADWFIGIGERRLKEGGWEAALAVAERGLRVLPEADARKVREWRGGVFRLWSQWFLDEKQGQDVEGSMKVLARAYALDENDKTVLAGLAYHTQEALRILDRKRGLKAMVEHYQALRKQFPRVDDIAAVAASHARRAVQQLVEDKKFKEAVAAADSYEPLLPRAELLGVAYAGWARGLAGDKQWKAALDKCAEGLKAAPEDPRLLQAVRAIVDEWAGPAVAAANWDEAIGIYNVGLDYLPGDEHLQHNKDYCGKMKK